MGKTSRLTRKVRGKLAELASWAEDNELNLLLFVESRSHCGTPAIMGLANQVSGDSASPSFKTACDNVQDILDVCNSSESQLVVCSGLTKMSSSMSGIPVSDEEAKEKEGSAQQLSLVPGTADT